VVVVRAATGVESANIDTVNDAKLTQHVLRVRGERLIVPDEVVVDTTSLTEHALRCKVEVVEWLRPWVDDVLDEFGERDVVASM